MTQLGEGQQIVPTSEDNRSSDTVRVLGEATYEIKTVGRREKGKTRRIDKLEFSIVSHNKFMEEGEQLIDPYLQTQLSEVTIHASSGQTTTNGQKQTPGSYNIGVYGYLGKEVNFFAVDYTLNQRTLKIKRENHRLPVRNNHAQSLFRLVDSFIPKQEPQPAPTTGSPPRRP